MNVNIARTLLPNFDKPFANNKVIRLMIWDNSFSTEVVLSVKYGKNEVLILLNQTVIKFDIT